MLTGGVVWAIISIKKIGKLPDLCLLMHSSFYKLLVILVCCESPNGPRHHQAVGKVWCSWPSFLSMEWKVRKGLLKMMISGVCF